MQTTKFSRKEYEIELETRVQACSTNHISITA